MLKNVAPMYGGMAMVPLLSECRHIMGDDMESAGSIDIARDLNEMDVTPAELRRALGKFLTGVTIVTTRTDSQPPYGLTVNSFNSVSLDPPLILWSLDLANDCTKMFRDAGAFAVNVMPAGSEDLIRRFSTADIDRFEGLSWHGGGTGQPVLDDALASFECRLWAEYPGGDHVIFVGEVLKIKTRDGDAAAYFKGQLGSYPS